MSDLTEGKLKTVIVNIEDVLSEDTTVFATSSSETKILSKIMQLLLDRQE